MADVFLSYAAEDRGRVLPIVRAIESAGFSVWWDRQIGIGRHFEREIERELDSARCVVAVWSEHSLSSDWVRNEAQEGMDRGVLVPIILDGVRPPLAFRRVQAAQVGTADDMSLRPVLDAITRLCRSEARVQQETSPASSSAGLVHTAAPSLSDIAVMPFDDLSPEGDQSWLIDGMAEELVDSLGRVRGLRVPARSSTSILKAQGAQIAEIADRLAVGSLVTGSVRRIGNRLMVLAQWVGATDQAVRWSARYERELEDVFQIQREIAAGIAEAIRRELGIHDAQEFVSRLRYRTADIRAWENFRKGVDLVFSFRPAKMAEGREFLRQALAIDPDFVDASAWLAWSEFDRPDLRIREAQKVLARDPTNAVALLTLADDCETVWDFQTCENLWRRAVAANPQNNQLTLHGYHLFSCLGRLEEVLEVTRRGVLLDPLLHSQHYFLGYALFNLGDPESAIEPLRRAVSLFDTGGYTGGLDVSLYHFQLSQALWQLGREREAVSALCNAFTADRAAIEQAWSVDGWPAANTTVARSLLERFERRPYVTMQYVATQLFAMAGEAERVYAQLDLWMTETRNFVLHDRDALRKCLMLAESLNADATFAPYRSEPRFAALRDALAERMSAAAGITGYDA